MQVEADYKREILTLARGLLLENPKVKNLIEVIVSCDQSEQRDSLMTILIADCVQIVCDWMDFYPSINNLIVFETMQAMLLNSSANYRFFGLGDFEPVKD